MTATVPPPLRQKLEPAIRFDPAWRTARPLNVALVRPPVYASRLNTSENPVPPLGLSYVAAAAQTAGHSVRVIDAIGEALGRPVSLPNGMVRHGLSVQEITERLGRCPDVIGVSCMFSNDWPHVRDMIRFLKNAFPGALIVGGGEHFTAAAEQSFTDCAELGAVVLGEGEASFVDLLEAVSGRRSLETVPGLAIRSNGTVRRSAARGRIGNIDDLPSPAWGLIPLENYLSRGCGMGTRRGRSIPMLATRGCPYQCTFCSSPGMWTVRWTPREPERILGEFEVWQNLYGVHNIEFFDLTAILNRNWILRFSQAIVDRDLRITWQLPVGTRSEAIDAEVARALKRSGCHFICYAPESGSRETLGRIRKMVDLENLKKSARACVSEGLRVKANILLGFPGETNRRVWETLGFIFGLARLGVHDVAISPFSPYPGTPLFEQLQRDGKLPSSPGDEWYGSLAYTDFKALTSYSEHFSLPALRFYQLIGYFLFYGASFFLRPMRFLRFVRDLLSNRQDTKGSTGLRVLIRRFLQRPEKAFQPVS